MSSIRFNFKFNHFGTYAFGANFDEQARMRIEFCLKNELRFTVEEHLELAKEKFVPNV